MLRTTIRNNHNNMINTITAYIPLQRKPIRVRASRWFSHSTRRFCVGNTNMLVSKKSRRPNVTPNQPNATPQQPNTSRWNIGRVGSRWVASRWGSRWPCTFHVVCLICLALGTRNLPNANAVWSGIWALNCMLPEAKNIQCKPGFTKMNDEVQGGDSSPPVFTIVWSI